MENFLKVVTFFWRKEFSLKKFYISNIILKLFKTILLFALIINRFVNF